MPNDMLIKLNIAFCTIREVKIKPVYGVGEKSKLKVLKVSFPICFYSSKALLKGCGRNIYSEISILYSYYIM